MAFEDILPLLRKTLPGEENLMVALDYRDLLRNEPNRLSGHERKCLFEHL